MKHHDSASCYVMTGVYICRYLERAGFEASWTVVQYTDMASSDELLPERKARFIAMITN